MTPRDFAVEIEPDASPERLHEIENILHRFAEQLLTEAAAKIDDAYLGHRISYCTQAAELCRDEASHHLSLT